MLFKEVPATKPVVNPRGSWLAKHDPEEIVVLKKKRGPFNMHTRSGDVIRVIPTKEKRIPMLRKNVPEQTIIELYAEARVPAERDSGTPEE
ncbi:hypothetical protein KSB_90500 [Ktedonobacter robiniae]|uniref:Uncharacterized protein n=1 Tax=Ktedonobacter robiniae TaxID=2778365 RepID=A0ABQ3V7H8_9CHLR|nr:hypothetical protein KSB_90500 [Ktedonobacter robiniae]